MEESKDNSTASFLRAEKTALRLVARAEQNTGGLARKLERRGHDSAVVSEVISRLCEQNLLNDTRFAVLWLQSRLRFARSPRRLLSSLCAKGIDRDTAETALKTVLNEDTETALLERFAKKYARGTHPIKYLLKSEGFSIAAINKFTDE